MKAESRTNRLARHAHAGIIITITAALAWPLLFAVSACGEESRRDIISLDGQWDIAEGTMDKMPQAFPSKCPVPGFADMAKPAFEQVGEKGMGSMRSFPFPKDPLREAFWYRREFVVDKSIPAVATLKINKARYGSRVYLNGQLLGDYLPCFTPAYFDVAGILKGNGQKNTLIVRIGSLRGVLPPEITPGRVGSIPGIYDSVSLNLSGTPNIERVQMVPDIEKSIAKAVTVIRNGSDKAVNAIISVVVREAKSGKDAGAAKSDSIALAPGESKTVSLDVAIANRQLWSPESPFLYRAEIATDADSTSVRFGMRSFRFDAKTKMGVLNGKQYALRGATVFVARFFQDPLRGDRPWSEQWVRNLIRAYKSVHWNSARCTVGFPPELWYEICDEEGFLIQDEFPVWFAPHEKTPPAKEELDTTVRIAEFTDWMRERWNHACVCIWDSSNETGGAAASEHLNATVKAVRGLDLSDRPWNNSSILPLLRPTDVNETHHYPMANIPKGNTKFHYNKLAGGLMNPGDTRPPGMPNIINEYDHIWLHRDGTPTIATKNVFERELGTDSTTEQRREFTARHLAAMTELFRCRRKNAGVQIHNGLSYSGPDGITCDNFEDITKPQWEPRFKKYVGDSFAPVGQMVDFWNEEVAAGAKLDVPVVVINDLWQDWKGDVKLMFMRGDKVIGRVMFTDGAKVIGDALTQSAKVESNGQTTIKYSIPAPTKPGQYLLVSELTAEGQGTTRSYRDVAVK